MRAKTRASELPRSKLRAIKPAHSAAFAKCESKLSRLAHCFAGNKGIAFKTFMFTSGLITLCVLISFGLLYAVLPDYYFRSKSSRLNKSADNFARSLALAKGSDECASLILAFSVQNNATVLPFNSDGVFMAELSSPLLAMNGEGKLNLRIQVKDAPENGASAEAATGRFFVTSSSIGQYDAGASGDMLLVSDSLSSIVLTKEIQNGLIDRVTIASTLQPISEAKNVILSLTPFLLAVDIVIALLAAYFYAHRLTKPILILSDAAAQMRVMTPKTASNLKSDDELGRLSENLDSMYESLCGNIESLKCEMELVQRLERSKTDFLRAASHELKTPIAALNGVTEGMIDNVGVYRNRDKYLRESKALIDRLTVIVGEILTASTLENAAGAEGTAPVDVAACLARALDENRLLIYRKNLRLTGKPFKFTFATDEKLLMNTLSNIVSNAVKHTEDGGRVRVAFRPETEKSGASLSVENECAPVPEDELPKLFEPFYTLDYSRDRRKSGTGLGLYIVRRNLERLNINYALENSELGLMFTLYFKSS